MSQAPVAVWRWRALIGASFVMTGMVTAVLGPLLPWISARWSTSDQALGFLFTAQFAGGLAGGAVSGVAGARLGVPRTLTIGFALMSAGLAALALGSRPLGAAGVCMSGVGLGLVIPTVNFLVARYEVVRTAPALGALNLAWGVGAAVWPLAIMVAASPGGIRYAVLTLAASCATLARPMGAAGARTPLMHIGSPDVARAVPGRGILFGVLILLYGGLETALGGWLPEHARRLAVDHSVRGWEFAGTAFWGGLTAGRAGVALAISRQREDAALLAGLALASCGIFSLFRTSDERAVIAAAVAGGVGLAPVFPVTVAALSREMRARIGSPLLALGGLGGATIPLMIGAVADRTGSLSSALRLLGVTSVVLFGLHAVRVMRANSAGAGGAIPRSGGPRGQSSRTTSG